MEKFKIEIDRKEIAKTINESIQCKIKEHLNKNVGNIEDTISMYFKKSFLNNNQNEFERALDYTIEIAFREGLEKAMEELNFKELLAKKAKELLSNDGLIIKIAEDKLRQSLGLDKN